MISTDPVVRLGSHQDLPRVVEIHQAAFPRFLMTQLGPKFLREYYRAVLECPGGILLIARDADCDALGFVSGAVRPDKFYRLLRQRRLRLALAGCGYLFIRPALWWRVLQNVFSVSSKGRAKPAEGCELASLAVDPAASGNGCGALLVSKFLGVAQACGATSVYLTTDSVENERVNRFYKRLGFQCTSQERRGRSRWMNRYEYKF